MNGKSKKNKKQKKRKKTEGKKKEGNVVCCDLEVGRER